MMYKSIPMLLDGYIKQIYIDGLTLPNKKLSLYDWPGENI